MCQGTKLIAFIIAILDNFETSFATFEAAFRAFNHTTDKGKVKFYNQKAETLANPNCPPSKWWQLPKELCHLNGRNSTTIPPLRTCAQDTVKNDQEKANLLNHTFINQNTCLNLEGFPIGPTQLKSVFTIQDICPADVRKIIKSLPNKASFGSDEISYRLLKEAGPGVIGPLTTLFNLSLHSSRVPDEWKEAIVCPIFKGGRNARQDPTNYRPISLTSCVARTMEKLVNNQMLAYLSENSLLYKHQSGFLPKHSTVTQLCYLAHQWQMALEKGEQVHTVFLDLSKAYDRVSIPFTAYCSSYQIWVFQTQLYNGCHCFWWIDSSVFW